MRIIKNNVSVRMGLEELLELMEEDRIDEVLQVVSELDESGVVADFEISSQFIDFEEDDIEGITPMFFLDGDGKEIDFEDIKEQLMASSEPITVGKANEEDKRVRNLLDLFNIYDDIDNDDYL